MKRLDVTLNGHAYALACEDGQEGRVRELLAYIDARLKDVARGAPGGSEGQILVLTALMLADEVFDLRDANQRLGVPASPPPVADLASDGVVGAVDTLARRIEAIAAKLERS